MKAKIIAAAYRLKSDWTVKDVVTAIGLDVSLETGQAVSSEIRRMHSVGIFTHIGKRKSGGFAYSVSTAMTEKQALDHLEKCNTRLCLSCTDKMEKRYNESWNQFDARMTCSISCASSIRNKSVNDLNIDRPAIVTPTIIDGYIANVINAMSGWHPGATKRHDLRGTA
jgi:hypothetical protein